MCGGIFGSESNDEIDGIILTVTEGNRGGQAHPRHSGLVDCSAGAGVRESETWSDHNVGAFFFHAGDHGIGVGGINAVCLF